MHALISQRVAPFLAISPEHKLSSRPIGLQKASPDLLCQSIENYEEVCEAVRSDLPASFRGLFNSDACQGGSDRGAAGPVGLAKHDCCPRC